MKLISTTSMFSTLITDNNFSSTPLGIKTMHNSHSTDERDVASVVAVTVSNSKKDDKRSERIEDRENLGPSKIRIDESCESSTSISSNLGHPCHPKETREATTSDPDSETLTLKPYPYFYYRDFSDFPDPDPLVPLTSPGRVPSFPAKMHSILSRPDLADVVAWNSHGRSWRVLKPREFELKVIPTYFEHAKFSSFIRQANGWGFRRVKQGQDRNSYYHELFLRGLPHLCKLMKRPGVSKKQATDIQFEPDLSKISLARPVPERSPDDSILLHCTLLGGPKARMPVCLGNLRWETVNSPIDSSIVPRIVASPSISSTSAPQLTGGTHAESSYPSSQLNIKVSPNLMTTTMDNHSINASCMPTHNPNKPQQPQAQPEHISLPQSAYMAVPKPPMSTDTFATPAVACIAHQNQEAIAPKAPEASVPSILNPLTLLPPELQGNSVAAAQFAAGFAAATVLNNQNFREMFGHTLASFPSIGTNGMNSHYQQKVLFQQQAPHPECHTMMAPQAQQYQGQPQHIQQQQDEVQMEDRDLPWVMK